MFPSSSKTGFPGRSSVMGIDMAAHQPLQDIQLDESMNSDLSPTMEPRPACFRNILHETLFVMVCSFAGGTFMYLQRSLVVIMDPLQTGLRMSASELSWTVAGPGLASGALSLPAVLFAERICRISRRNILAASLLLYSLLVGVCAASVDGIFLDVFVAVAGLTCAMHLAVAISILDSAYPYPSTRKTMATTFFLVSSNPSAIVVGSLLSGDIALHFTWRGSFVFLSVLSALAAMFSLLVVPNFDRRSNLRPPSKEVSDEEEDASCKGTGTLRGLDFDWRGTLLLLLAIGLFTVAFTTAPESHDGWSTPYVWLLFSISLICLGMFVYWERVAQYPLIPSTLWDNPGLLVCLLFVFLTSMSGCALIFWVPLFMEAVQFQTSFQTAVRLLPAAVTGIFISPWLNLFLRRLNHSLVAGIAAFCMIASNIALLYLRSDRNYWTTTFPAMILSTVAMDWCLSVATAALLAALPLHHRTAALGLVVTVARLAIPAGLAVTTAIHTSFAGRSDMTFPEVPYTNVFYATLSLAVLALTLVPFLHVEKPASRGKKTPLSMVANFDESEDLGYRDFMNGPAILIQPRTSSLYIGQKHTAAADNEPKTPHLQHHDDQGDKVASSSNNAFPPAGRRGRGATTRDRVIWLVCEDCGASKRVVEQVGDPTRYFGEEENVIHEKNAEGRAHLGNSSSGSVTSTVRRFPLCKDLNSLRG